MKILKWNGKEDTLMRSEWGGVKTPVKVGGTIEVSDKMAEMYLKSGYKKENEVIEEK